MNLVNTRPACLKQYTPPPHGGISVAELRKMGMRPDMVVDFSVSVNPLGPPIEVNKNLRNMDFSSYPDIENLILREAVGKLTGINPGQIIFGNGSMELINLLAQAYLQKGDTVFILGPTFSEYEMAARRKNAEVIYLSHCLLSQQKKVSRSDPIGSIFHHRVQCNQDLSHACRQCQFRWFAGID